MVKKYFNYFSASVTSGFLSRLNIIILGNYGSGSLLKIYDLTFRIIKILEIPFILFQTALLPHVIARKKEMNRMLALILTITIFLVIIFNLIFKPFFLFYTNETVVYNAIIVFLISLILPISSVSSYMGSILYKLNKSRVILLSEIINLIIYSIVLSILLLIMETTIITSIILAQLIAAFSVVIYKKIKLNNEFKSN